MDPASRTKTKIHTFAIMSEYHRHEFDKPGPRMTEQLSKRLCVSPGMEDPLGARRGPVAASVEPN